MSNSCMAVECSAMFLKWALMICKFIKYGLAL
jgi:hypothetical protein